MYSFDNCVLPEHFDNYFCILAHKSNNACFFPQIPVTYNKNISRSAFFAVYWSKTDIPESLKYLSSFTLGNNKNVLFSNQYASYFFIHMFFPFFCNFGYNASSFCRTLLPPKYSLSMYIRMLFILCVFCFFH